MNPNMLGNLVSRFVFTLLILEVCVIVTGHEETGSIGSSAVYLGLGELGPQALLTTASVPSTGMNAAVRAEVLSFQNMISVESKIETVGLHDKGMCDVGIPT